MKWITASHSESWARRNVARGSLPGLIASLVRGSAREIGTIRFPKEDKAQIHGFDGHLVAHGVPFLTGGESFWELGCGEDYVKKANSGCATDPNYGPRVIKQPTIAEQAKAKCAENDAGPDTECLDYMKHMTGSYY